MSEVYTPEEKRIIAGRARPLLERLADVDALEQGDEGTLDPAEVFDEWREQFPNDEAFERRLDRLGATEAECMTAISADRLAPGEPIPEWVERLDDLVASVQSTSADAVIERIEQGQTGPQLAPWTSAPREVTERGKRFPELSAAITAHMLDELPDEPVREVLTPAAVATMAEWFRMRLEESFRRILFVEFKQFVAAHDRDVAFADPEEFDEPPTEYYEAFNEYLFTTGFADFCYEYPVFAHLVTTKIRQWYDHLEEFCRRLRDDRAALAETFDADDDGDGDLGAVVDLEPLADDTHGDGRAVMRAEFSSGFEVVYKPRSVEAGMVFYEVFGRLDAALPTPEFETPTYLDRGEYGWMELLEYDECEDEAAVERYYRRAGVLACVTYLLEFRDCQFENLLVTGEQPTLVDAETVMHPYFDVDRRPRRSGIGALTEDSVLLTSLLPFSVDDVHGEGQSRGDLMADFSGFCVSSDVAEVEGVPVARIRAANTDVMSVEKESAQIDRGENVPKVDGEDHPPTAYVDEIVDGFETTYETILDLRDEGRLSAIGLPDAFEGIENRSVYRPTIRYGEVLRSVSSRGCLADGARFGVELEALTVPFCDGRVEEPAPWSAYDAERVALRRHDPPRFTCRTDGTTIRMAGEDIGLAAKTSGFERCAERIESASRADLREQVEFVRGCLGETPSPALAAESGRTGPREAVDDETLREEAVSLFEAVRDASLRTADGTPYWASIEPWPDTEAAGRFAFRPARGTTYVGRPGIALFGAALYRLTGEERYRTFALDAVEPVRESLTTEQSMPAFSNHGGTSGLGSVAYGMGTVGSLLDEPALVDEATLVTESITPASIASDDRYDVTAGSAGTILGLLGLHDRTGTPELVSAAADCGDHLLSSRTAGPDGLRAWETIEDGTPLTGFAHGAAGIAYALCRLWDETGRDEFRDAALEGVEYEARSYDESAANWPDFRQGEWTDPHTDQWCHGRSGIGLARLGMAACDDDERISRGVDRAIDGLELDGVYGLDHLCCGNAGRAEFLLEVERRRGSLDGAARELLGGVLARKRETGAYRNMVPTVEITDPTFFHGVSGIGYAMLRVTAPETLPNVLLWE